VGQALLSPDTSEVISVSSGYSATDYGTDESDEDCDNKKGNGGYNAINETTAGAEATENTSQNQTNELSIQGMGM
jgi:hypothetical protein